MAAQSFMIDPPAEPSREFLEARNIAGRTLQTQFHDLGGRVESPQDFRWIKAELTWPSFDHLTFGYCNQVFSVLVELVQGDNSSLSTRERDRCLEAARANNLVACVFSIDARTLQPLATGWNLIGLADGRPIQPETLSTDAPVLMSEWELRNFAIQFVRGHIEEQLKGRILSFCDVLGIDPQIWFENSAGRRCWVVSRFCRTLVGTEKEAFIGLEATNPQLLPFDGYFAGVSAASSAPVLHDLDGQIISPSRRFDGTAPLYRGDGFYLKFSGLEPIHVS